MKLVVVLLLAILMVGCEDPAITSRVGDYYGEDERAVVVLKNGDEVNCVYAKQIEVGGWECWNYSPSNDKYPDSKRWFDDGAVQEVRPEYKDN